MAIMISVKPEWVYKILNRDKILEIRKSCPKGWKDYLSGKTKVKPEPQKCFIYCTKGKPYLYRIDDDDMFELKDKIKYLEDWEYGYVKDYNAQNAKVVAEFMLEEVEKISCCYIPYRNYNNLGYEYFIDNGVYQHHGEDGLVFERDDNRLTTMLKNKDFEKMCLKPIEIYNYLGGYGTFYMWHISNLKIYGKPKELSEFKKQNKCYQSGDLDNLGCFESGCVEFEKGICDSKCSKIDRPPQSWCYCEEVNNDN